MRGAARNTRPFVSIVLTGGGSGAPVPPRTEGIRDSSGPGRRRPGRKSKCARSAFCTKYGGSRAARDQAPQAKRQFGGDAVRWRTEAAWAPGWSPRCPKNGRWAISRPVGLSRGPAARGRSGRPVHQRYGCLRSTAPADRPAFTGRPLLHRNATTFRGLLRCNMRRYSVTSRSENSAGPAAPSDAVRPAGGSAPRGRCVLQLQEHRLRGRSGSRPIRLKFPAQAQFEED